MRKLSVVLLSVVVLVAFALHAVAEYDKDAVVEVMRANGVAMGEIKKALEAGDFYTTATKLMEVAQNVKSLDAYTPPKGSKEEWDAVHHDLIKAAFKGIGACGEEDAEKVNQYIGEVSALIKEGHTMFR